MNRVLAVLLAFCVCGVSWGQGIAAREDFPRITVQEKQRSTSSLTRLW